MRIKMTIEPVTAFATPLLGEILFGQLCWAIRQAQSDAELTELLDGYCQGSAFAVISDAFPSGYLPLPSLPNTYWQEEDESLRKDIKARHWIGLSETSRALKTWRHVAKKDSELEKDHFARVSDVRTHNSIHRTTLTTGNSPAFAPFNVTQTWFAPHTLLDIYAVIDSSRFSLEHFKEAFIQIGQTGYGQDASSGLGKFVVKTFSEVPSNPTAQHYMTLASCSPVGMSVLSEQCFYKIKTHFGRHGEVLANYPVPFKKPILLAQSSAVITLEKPQAIDYFGQGIAGISHVQPAAVHQGYTPVIALPALKERAHE